MQSTAPGDRPAGCGAGHAGGGEPSAGRRAGRTDSGQRGAVPASGVELHELVEAAIERRSEEEAKDRRSPERERRKRLGRRPGKQKGTPGRDMITLEAAIAGLIADW